MLLLRVEFVILSICPRHVAESFAARALPQAVLRTVATRQCVFLASSSFPVTKRSCARKASGSSSNLRLAGPGLPSGGAGNAFRGLPPISDMPPDPLDL